MSAGHQHATMCIHQTNREKHLHLLIPGGDLSSSAVPPSLLTGNHKINPYPYDPEGANSLLEEAGFAGGFDTELWVGGGSEMFHVLEAFQADWASVGINVSILHSDWNVFKASVKDVPSFATVAKDPFRFSSGYLPVASGAAGKLHVF